MKVRQLIKAACFTALFLALLVAVSYCVRMNGDVKDRFVGFYAEKRNTLDAVVIGSSPVYPAIATPMLYGEQGIALYPLSSNMQRPVAGLYLTREVLKYQKPRLFIYEVRMYTAEDEALLGNLAHTREVTDNLRYSVNRLRTIRAMVEEPSERRDFYIDIFKYHSNWKTLVLPSQLRTWRYAYPEKLKGFGVYDEVGPAEGSLEPQGDDRLPIPGEQEEALRALITFLRGEGQEALFLVVPHTTRTEQTDAMYRYMEDLVTAEGFRFLNMNGLAESEFGFDAATDFRDYGNHLNAVGARKLTAWFGAWLKEHYTLPDHRGDAAYRSWDAAWLRWQEADAAAGRTIAEHLADKSYYVIPEEGEE